MKFILVLSRDGEIEFVGPFATEGMALAVGMTSYEPLGIKFEIEPLLEPPK